MYGNFWGNLGNFLFHHLITLLSITLLTIHTYGDPHKFYFQFPFHLSLSLVLFLALSLSFCLYLTQMGQSRPLFCLFSSFSSYNFNNTNWKKHWWCAWDSNPGPQDGRCRQSQGAMAATLYLTLFLLYLFPSFSSSICICLLSLSPDPIFCFFLCHSSLYLSLSLLELML